MKNMRRKRKFGGRKENKNWVGAWWWKWTESEEEKLKKSWGIKKKKKDS